ncbi:hypothetical protein QBC45DRAFT_416576 [Copromyces sp. CBS 386.78]|nr:hypothetical protein QBC45DRAFT_416576 [Copromyces sp. CBS 386.78]
MWGVQCDGSKLGLVWMDSEGMAVLVSFFMFDGCFCHQDSRATWKEGLLSFLVPVIVMEMQLMMGLLIA